MVLVSSASNSTIANISNSVVNLRNTDYKHCLNINWWIYFLGRQDRGNLFCNPRTLLFNASNLGVFDYPIECYLSEPKEGICSVQLSLTVMWVVIGYDALKIAAMIWILFCFSAKTIAGIGWRCYNIVLESS